MCMNENGQLAIGLATLGFIAPSSQYVVNNRGRGEDKALTMQILHPQIENSKNLLSFVFFQHTFM